MARTRSMAIRNRRLRLLLDSSSGGGVSLPVGPDVADLSTTNAQDAAFETEASAALGTHFGLAVDRTGTYAYAADLSNNKYFRWTMSTPWDVDSFPSPNDATQNVAEVNTDLETPMIAGNGLFFYGADRFSANISQIPLSSAYDITSVGAESLINFAADTDFGADVSGLAFNNDGTIAYVCDTAADRIAQYTLSTAYDLTSRGEPTYGSAMTDVGLPFGIDLDGAGTKLYVATSAGLKQYNMSTAWDITTASTTADSTLAGAAYCVHVDRVNANKILTSNTANLVAQT